MPEPFRFVLHFFSPTTYKLDIFYTVGIFPVIQYIYISFALLELSTVFLLYPFVKFLFCKVLAY